MRTVRPDKSRAPHREEIPFRENEFVAEVVRILEAPPQCPNSYESGDKKTIAM